MVIFKDNNGILEMGNDPKFEPNSKGYGVHCYNKMKEFSDQIAQINVDTNQSDTYEDILLKSIRVALNMKAMGIQENDIISLCTNTHSEMCLPFWATVFLGATTANLDPTLSLSDIKYLLKMVKPKLIFSVPESGETLETAIKDLDLNTKIVVFGNSDKHFSFREFLKPQNEERDFKPVPTKNIFDTVSILFSSGTTGYPKGVCVTHYGILELMNIYIDIYNMKTVLFYTGPYWISFMLLLSSTVIVGGKRILRNNFDPTLVLKLIQDYEVTMLFMPPTFVNAVAYDETIKKYNTSSLHSMMIGGGTLLPEKIEKIKKLFPKTFINQAYGMTEISCLFSTFDPKTDMTLAENKITSCGKMLPGISCKVVDTETNKILNKNQRGELLIKTKRVMGGYYNDPEKTAEAFDENNFLHSGDIVYYDEDYCFYVVDRIKEMFKYKSWHITPAELENILLNHPVVKEVLVIGYPHEEDGDHAMAVIIPKEGVSASENEILHYFNRQVPDRKKLRAGIKFVKSLPKTPTGKYSRVKLRQMIVNNEI